MKTMQMIIAGLLSSLEGISENSLYQGNHRIGMKYRKCGTHRTKGKRDMSMRSRANRKKAKRRVK